jgi:adenosine deaminase
MLPVAELHIHIEGTLEPELLVKLARRNGTWMPTLDVDELRAKYRFDSLRSFLDLHYANLRVLKIEQDFYDLARAYLARAAAGGVRRAEIFFDPQTHLANGVPLEEVFGGLSAALAAGATDHGISADLILCFQRDLGPDAADAVLRACLPFRDSFIGVGLDSTEVGYPPALFAQVYQLAAAEGLRLVAHAGEEGGPDYVREALDLLNVERVDHGVRSMEDPEMVARLRDQQIPLTVCPLSRPRRTSSDGRPRSTAGSPRAPRAPRAPPAPPAPPALRAPPAPPRPRTRSGTSPRSGRRSARRSRWS